MKRLLLSAALFLIGLAGFYYVEAQTPSSVRPSALAPITSIGDDDVFVIDIKYDTLTYRTRKVPFSVMAQSVFDRFPNISSSITSFHSKGIGTQQGYWTNNPSIWSGSEFFQPTNAEGMSVKLMSLNTNGLSLFIPMTGPTVDALKSDILTSSNSAVAAAVSLAGTTLLNRGTLYVDAVSGNDATAIRESYTKTYATIAGASAASQIGDTIALLRGTFSESQVALKSNVTIYIASGAKIRADNKVGAGMDLNQDFMFTTAYDLNVSGPGTIELYRGALAKVGRNVNLDVGTILSLESAGGLECFPYWFYATNTTMRAVVKTPNPLSYIQSYFSAKVLDIYAPSSPDFSWSVDHSFVFTAHGVDFSTLSDFETFEVTDPANLRVTFENCIVQCLSTSATIRVVNVKVVGGLFSSLGDVPFVGTFYTEEAL